MYTGQGNSFTIHLYILLLIDWFILKSHSLIKWFLNIETINDSGHNNTIVILIKYKSNTITKDLKKIPKKHDRYQMRG